MSTSKNKLLATAVLFTVACINILGTQPGNQEIHVYIYIHRNGSWWWAIADLYQSSSSLNWLGSYHQLVLEWTGHHVCTIPLYLSAFFTFQHRLVIYRVIIRSIPPCFLATKLSSQIGLEALPLSTFTMEGDLACRWRDGGCPLTPAMTCCPPRCAPFVV